MFIKNYSVHDNLKPPYETINDNNEQWWIRFPPYGLAVCGKWPRSRIYNKLKFVKFYVHNLHTA